MAFTLVVNGVTYQDTDFAPDNYGRNLERLLGDIFQELAEEWTFPIISFTSDIIFLVANKNTSTSTVLSSLYVGSRVVYYSLSKPTKHRVYGIVSALAQVGANVTVTLAAAVSSISPPSAIGLEAVTDWVMQVGGDANLVSGTVALANGGTGQTTDVLARKALAQISPADFMQSFREDFAGGYGLGLAVVFNKLRGYRFNAKLTANGAYNPRAQIDNLVSRYPGTRLESHPGLCEMSVYSAGDVALLDAAFWQLDGSSAVVENYPFRLAGAGTQVMEVLFKLSGDGLVDGQFNLRMGLWDGAGTNEYGFGIRPFGQNLAEPNIVRAYGMQASTYRAPTVGSPFTNPIVANTWYRVVFSKVAAGTTTAVIYILDEDGNASVTGNLGGHTAANLPTTVGLRPFIRLEQTLSPTSGPVNLLVDYFCYEKSVTR